MSSTEKLKRKIISVLKLNGFTITSQIATTIINTFDQARINLNDSFDHYIKIICDFLEKHTVTEKSIEEHVIKRALEACFHLGVDDHETKFSVIDAFNYPILQYDLSRKHYFLDTKTKVKMISEADKKIDLFVCRYRNILQRANRCFKQKNLSLEDSKKFHINTVDVLLTVSQRVLERNFILGSLIRKTGGKYFIEDPTGRVELDLKHTKYHVGFYCENCFVLVNGIYSDRILQVCTMMLPAVEEFKESMTMFTHLNYFGGQSEFLLRESVKLNELMQENSEGMMVFLSDLWFDKEIVFEKLELLFEGFSANPPIAFIFIGDFISQRFMSEASNLFLKSFKRLAEMIQKHTALLKNSYFVFVPGMNDPYMPHILPRLPLPNILTKDFQKIVPKAIFTSNPCRIQYCTREIVIYRNDILSKFMQDSLNKPSKNKLDEFVARTVLSQAHLSPFSLNSQPVHWNFDYTLHLYPLPNLLVIGDKCNPYEETYKGCTVMNPGCFIESGFSFKTYIPATDTVEDCSL